MKINKNKKCESTSVIILWIGVILATLIVIFWAIGKTNMTHYSFEKTNSDLDEIQGKINQACISHYYNAHINPVTEKGVFKTNGTLICINNTKIFYCKETMCNLSSNIIIDLKNITYINILKEENKTEISITGTNEKEKYEN